MKIFKFKSYFTLAAIALVVATVSCERGFSDEIAVAKYPSTPEVFTDFPVGLTDAFFVSFDPADGANVNGFGTDESEAYRGNTSIRIEVPAPNDPDGGFIGGIFLDRGNGRDLTAYDALTFWAKGSTTADVGLFGFGTDFEGDKYAASLSDVALSTAWKQYIIPIPDASKLVQEKGMFVFSAGTLSTNGMGFTIWIDEIRFEKLGNIAQPRPSIFDGNDNETAAFKGDKINVTGTSQTFNMGDGSDVTVTAAASYFDYKSSDPFVAQVSEDGVITVVGLGTATITASLNGVDAVGSLEIEATELNFPPAPVPTHSAADVISIFSDAYTSAAGINFDPRWLGSTTEYKVYSAGGDEFSAYKNNNYTGIVFDENPIDASSKTHMHVDVLVEEAGSTKVDFQIRDIGANGKINSDNNGFPIDDDKDYRFTADGLTVGEWKSFEIPLAGNLASQKDKIGLIVLVGGPNFILDNIYFY
ncbi:MAG: glycosyl hydrolase family 16 [Flavobacteriaceae bacterium]